MEANNFTSIYRLSANAYEESFLKKTLRWDYMPERYQQLDALRGLAALTVVMQHFLSVLPSIDGHSDNAWVNLWKYSPLHITWAGYEAVIFFFILSGFVLSLPFYGER